MWVVKQKNGKFKYTERYEDFLTGKQKYVSTTLSKNSPQAHNKAEAILGEKINKKRKPTATHDIAFSQLVDEWLSVLKKLDLSYSTKVNYESQAKVVTKEIGNVKLEKLTAPLINKTLLDYLNGGRSYNTVAVKYMVIRLILKFAIDYGFLESSFPVFDIKIPNINKPIKTALTDKYLEPDEAERIFKVLKENDLVDLYYLFKIQLYTGMRFNEATALSLSQIDFDNRKICINRQYNYRAKDFTLPKRNKIRTIAYNLQLEELFAEILKRRRFLLKIYHGKTDLLVFNKHLMPFLLTNANYNLKQITFSKKLTTHIFRHTYITRMVENYVPPKLIAKQVGHTNTKLIDEIYGHFSEKMRSDLQEKINQISF